MVASRSYHHGDLRRAVLDAAIDVIATEGPGAVSLRDLARRAGVSHAAPAHHFIDKAGLLTAVAVEGYELLADSLAASDPSSLRELGVRYVRFAVEHPAHFAVMFSPDLYHRDAPELASAAARAAALLRGGVGAMPAGRRGSDIELAGLAAWCLAHGFATLYNGENLARAVGERPPDDTFRAMAELMFGGRSG
jgi:AcrR family transcriptional regulator